MQEKQPLQNIERYLAYSKRWELGPKSTVFNDGDASNSLFYIVSGTVTVLKKDEKGREMIVGYLFAGDFFGELYGR